MQMHTTKHFIRIYRPTSHSVCERLTPPPPPTKTHTWFCAFTGTCELYQTRAAGQVQWSIANHNSRAMCVTHSISYYLHWRFKEQKYTKCGPRYSRNKHGRYVSALAQVDSRCTLVQAALSQSQTSPCVNCSRHSSKTRGLPLPVLRFLSSRVIPAMVHTHSFIYHHVIS